MNSAAPSNEARRRAMGAVACMPAGRLAECYAHFEKAPKAVPIRGPETGLVMLRGRAGGGGAAFNLGEASVVRATVKLATGEVGHAMVLGRDVDHARMAAHLDALWQHAAWRGRVEDEVVAPALAEATVETVRRAEETEATRVDFFTLVRGEDR